MNPYTIAKAAKDQLDREYHAACVALQRASGTERCLLYTSDAADDAPRV